MTTHHPDLVAEQAYLDHAYACLERSREAAWRLRTLTETGRGGTHQARYETEVLEENLRTRLTQLDLRDAALVFGRIDRHPQLEGSAVPAAELGNGNGHDTESVPVETFHIGRLAVSDDQRDPVVVDWRAPVAEPFYRATGREPMGLVRRRHFMVKGRELLGIEDELFGEGHIGVSGEAPEGIRGYSTLLAALEANRTGTLGDIVATIQAEQDQIIRSPQAGVLVVQGGPGTGKTVVALHRAAYLLYTFRFPLEDQGVLVIGPNRVFLRYIDQVLPSLGEAGVEQVVLADLVPDVRFGAVDSPLGARVKGDVRTARVIDKAIRDRQRALKTDLVVPFGLQSLRLRVAESERIVHAARRRYRRHNAGRRFVEAELWAALAASSRDEISADVVRERLRHDDQVRVALERMWPVLTPAQLLHDLYGSMALLRLAGSRWLSEDELTALHRPRTAELGEVRFSDGDIALLDEARYELGPKPVKGGKLNEEEEIRTYGHIVVDEVQDLTPMQLRMTARRSLNGSMTVVGDIAQATGPHAPRHWDDVLAHLPDRKPARVTELTVGYRIPAQSMELAARVLREAMPGMEPPTSVRQGESPRVVAVSGGAAGLAAAVVAAVEEVDASVGGNVAVVVPNSLAGLLAAELVGRGLDIAEASRVGLDHPVTLVPVSLVKGLELDGVVVVEPGRIVAEEPQGLRALYVALTRATKRLTVVHAEPLPSALND